MICPCAASRLVSVLRRRSYGFLNHWQRNIWSGVWRSRPPPLPPPVSVGGFLGSIWKLALEFCCNHTLSHEGWLADTNQLEYVLEQHSVNVRFVPQDLSRTASEHKQIPDSAMPSQHSRTSTQQHNTISLLSRSKTPDK